jgi:hypothetical protein
VDTEGLTGLRQGILLGVILSGSRKSAPYADQSVCCWVLKMKSNDLILLLLGAVAAFVVQLALPALWRFMCFVWRYFTDESPLLGHWHAYHCTYRGNRPTVIKSVVTVRKGINTPYVAALRQDDASQLVYRGVVSRERHHLIFHFDSLQHAENVIARFPEPLGPGCTTLYGIWLSYDHDQNIASGGMLLSRQPLNNVDPLQVLAHGFDLPRGRPQLRVVKRG